MRSGFHGGGLLCEGKGEAWEGMKKGSECDMRGHMARDWEGKVLLELSWARLKGRTRVCEVSEWNECILGRNSHDEFIL